MVLELPFPLSGNDQCSRLVQELKLVSSCCIIRWPLLYHGVGWVFGLPHPWHPLTEKPSKPVWLADECH